MQDGTQRYMNDAELVDRLKRFDAQHVSWIVEHYGEALHRYLTAIVADPHLAEDIVAEIYIRILERIGDYKVTGAPFRAWLYRIAHDLAINAVTCDRSAFSDLRLARAEVLSGNPAGIFEREELHRALRRALQTLTEEQQQVLLFRFVARLSMIKQSVLARADELRLAAASSLAPSPATHLRPTALFLVAVLAVLALLIGAFLILTTLSGGMQGTPPQVPRSPAPATAPTPSAVLPTLVASPTISASPTPTGGYHQRHSQPSLCQQRFNYRRCAPWNHRRCAPQRCRSRLRQPLYHLRRRQLCHPHPTIATMMTMMTIKAPASDAGSVGSVPAGLRVFSIGIASAFCYDAHT